MDSLETIGGHPITVAGAPRLVDTPLGWRGLEFDGAGDGIFMRQN